jgi:hypothetical protein
MSTLAWIILAFVVGIGASACLAVVVKSRASGEIITAATAWEKIRPTITKVLIEGIKIYQANKEGYEALVKYCATYIKNEVDACEALTTEEKSLITYDFIYSVIEPQLEKLWNETNSSETTQTEVATSTTDTTN